MRIPSPFAVAIVALFLVPSVGSGQSLAEAAAKEKARRKALEESRKKPARSYTDTDLANAQGSNASFPTGADADAPAAEPAAGTEAAAGSENKPPEKSEDDKRAEASAGWRKSLDAANKDAATYSDQVARIQNDLNDTSGGLYTSRRNTLVTLLDETQKKLTATQAKIADLEEQGRRNGYR